MIDAATPPVLRIRDLRKSFGPLEVLKGINLDVYPGERIAILGGSGSGKSTLLRCMNFIEVPTAGQVEVAGITMRSSAKEGNNSGYRSSELNALRRKVGMIFQDFNLFPHMTALQNVMEALVIVKRMKRDEAGERARAHLASVGLSDRAHVHPRQLSGGQQQRVAIARALAMDPEVLLLDEPTSSLDPELVVDVLHTIRALALDGRTMLLVTHELGFAYHFATRVLFLADGVIQEEGAPDQVLKNPRSEKTRAFLAKFTEFSF